MANNVHIIPHMHWDREWYFTTEESCTLLVNNMEEIIDMLETNENYPYYILDGQTAILEDYFSIKAENKDKVKNLVAKGKLIIGPWYTQTDEMVVGGESIVRNLLYGIKDCKEFGPPMMIGYLPDSFGQSEKLPQILNGFDINHCIFWRGSSERHGTNKHNFFWKSNDTGKVLVQLLPLGYAIGKYLPVDKEQLKIRMDRYFDVLDSGAVTEDIILPNGHDQMPIQENIFEVMEQLKKLYPDRKFHLSKYENVFEQIEKKEDLDTIEGELLDGKYMRVHRSIFSSRADLKSDNTRIENKITNILEPLASMACCLGASYEKGFLENIWKELMKNHAHDSIGCCCSDIVHKSIKNRFFSVENKVDELIKFYKRKIVDAISVENNLDKLTVFNFIPYEREEVIESEIITKYENFLLKDIEGKYYDFEIIKKEIIDPGLIDRQIVHYGNYNPFIKFTIVFKDLLPAMGYKTFYIEETDQTHNKTITESSTDYMENDYYQVTIESNGTLTIFDKEEKQEYKNILLVEDGSDDGDEYDYSPLKEDYIITSLNVTAKSEVMTYKNKSLATISYQLQIPKDLQSRKEKICNGYIDITFHIELKKNSKTICAIAEINNQCKDHRVRVLIPQQIESKFSMADNQFGEIQRQVIDPAMEIWEEEKWDERPDAIYPMLTYVSTSHKKGFAFLTNSVREYEIIGENYDTIAITLFRSVGYLGKENLYRRPGRPSGIKMETKDAQLIGSLTFEFAIVKSSSNIAKDAKEYLTPIIFYNKIPYNAMKLNKPNFKAKDYFSWFSLTSKDFILSTVKKAEEKEGFVIRGYQVKESVLETKIEINNKMHLCNELKLNEYPICELDEKEWLSLPRNVVKNYYIK